MKKPISITKAELAKMPRSEQRRYMDLGYVQGEETPAAKAEKAAAKAKPA